MVDGLWFQVQNMKTREVAIRHLIWFVVHGSWFMVGRSNKD
jgi:hypothetical protein